MYHLCSKMSSILCCFLFQFHYIRVIETFRHDLSYPNFYHLNFFQKSSNGKSWVDSLVKCSCPLGHPLHYIVDRTLTHVYMEHIIHEPFDTLV